MGFLHELFKPCGDLSEVFWGNGAVSLNRAKTGDFAIELPFCEPFTELEAEEPETVELPMLAFWNRKPLPEYESNKDYAEILHGAHTLIAGRTGCGKSVMLNGLLRELMGTRLPNDCGLVLIDPKRVELAPYRNTPYCLGYASDNKTALNLLSAVVDLIEERYEEMQKQGVRTWQGGKVYVVIDELADLLIDIEYGARIKRALQKILQIARASGVSVLACTQCPSRSVIPAPITLNFTERIALKCNSAIESRQIINSKGAEELPKHGTGLYLGADGLRKMAIPFLPEAEQEKIINYWKK